MNEVENCPLKALVTLFQVGACAANYVTQRCSTATEVEEVESIVAGLWKAVNEHPKAFVRKEMIETFCQVVFRPEVMANTALNQPGSVIQSTLGKMLDANLNGIPLVGRAGVMYASKSWQQGDGQSAVPYRDIIFEMVLHKEAFRKGTALEEQEEAEEATESQGFEGNNRKR